MIRILVVEDSATVRKALTAALEADPEIQVVASVASGEEAIESARLLAPDLITMDINLPGMDGFQATRAIMSTTPVPIVIISGKLDPKDSAVLFQAMEAGALMVLAKPAPVGSPEHAQSMARIIHNLKLMSEIKVVRRLFPREPARAPAPPPSWSPAHPVTVVAIGASTGGPPLLQRILCALPADYGAALLVVQHMAEGFTEHFVHWLGQHSQLPVRLASQDCEVLPGQVLVAPDGFHMVLGPCGRILLSEAPPEHGVRPAISALFRSVAHYSGQRGAGVLLTGMGSDGALELKSIKERGGITIAQDRDSCVVFGMPGEAVRLKAAQHVLAPEAIIEMLKRLPESRSKDPQAETR